MADFDLQNVTFEPQIEEGPLRLENVAFEGQQDEVGFSEKHQKAVQAPRGLSSDEFDYRVERDVNARPVGDFMLMSDLSKAISDEIGVDNFMRGIAESAVTIGTETVGGGLREFALTAKRDEPEGREVDPELQSDFQLMSAIAGAFIDPVILAGQKGAAKVTSFFRGEEPVETLNAMDVAGQKIVEHGKEIVRKINKDVKPGEENPVESFMGVLGQGTTSVAASLGLTYVTKRPALAGVMFAGIQKESVFLERLEEGKTPSEASRTGFSAGVVEGAFEGLGGVVWLKAVSSNSKYMRRIIPALEEATQETLQQTGEEIIQADIRDDSLAAKAKRVGVAAAAGFVLGGASSVVIEQFHKQMPEQLTSEQKAQEAEQVKKLQEDPRVQKEVEKLVDNEVSKMNVTPEEETALLTELNTVIREAAKQAQVEEQKPLTQFNKVLSRSLQEKFKEVNVRENELKILREEEKVINKLLPQLESEETVSDEKALSKAKENDFNIDFSSREEVNEFVDQLIKNRQEIRKRIADIRFKFKKRLESTDVKNAVRRVLQGARRGAVIKKAEIADIQKQVRQLVEESGLERPIKDRLLRGIENVNTIKKKNKKVEFLQEKIAEIEREQQRRELINRFSELTKRTNVKTLSAEFRGPVEEIIDEFDPATISKRKLKDLESLSRALDQNDANEIPHSRLGELARLGKKPLKELPLDELQLIVDSLDHAYHLSNTKKRLIIEGRERELNSFIGDIAEKVFEKTGVKIDDKFPQVSEQTRRGFDDVKRKAFRLLDETRKVEFMLDQVGAGDVFTLLRKGHAAWSKETLRTTKEIDNLFGQLKAESVDMQVDLRQVEGVKNRVPQQDGYTREDLITIVLNSKSPGNMQRLTEGWGFTVEEIVLIEEDVNSRPQDAAFVEGTFNLLDSLWEGISNTTKQLTGITPVRVEGRYFPIKTDRLLAKQVSRDDLDVDLNDRVFEAIQFRDSFSKERVGGVDPVSLKGFKTILGHVQDALHYSSMAVPVDSMQKVLGDRRMNDYLTFLLGENFNDQATKLLRDVANPRRLSPTEETEVLINGLRHMSSVFFLGYSVSVSAVQASSLSLTVGAIGPKWTGRGINAFFKGREDAVRFVHERAPDIELRGSDIIRDIDDLLKSDQIKELLGKGRKGILSREMIFSWIRGVDATIVYPTWMGAYLRAVAPKSEGGLGLSEDAAITEASKVVEKTQPTAALQNLPTLLRSGGFKKVFVPFMTFFTNVHNTLVNAGLETQYDQSGAEKANRLVNALVWAWMVPALASTFLRSLSQADQDDYVTDFFSWIFMGSFFLRDFASGVIGDFQMFHPPAFIGFDKVQKLKRQLSAEDPDYFDASITALESGAFFTKVPRQMITSSSGLLEHMMGRSEDWRRIFFTEGRIKYGFDKNDSKKKRSRQGKIFDIK